jgi:hypothetical protein
MLKPVEQRIDEGFLLKELIPVWQIEISRDDGGQSLGIAVATRNDVGPDSQSRGLSDAN